jgi:hypothetical protein
MLPDGITRVNFNRLCFDRNSKLIVTPFKKVKRVNSVITGIYFVVSGL